MRRSIKIATISIFITMALIVGLLPCGAFAEAENGSQLLGNLGFETGDLYRWDKVAESDVVSVVEAEGPAQFDTYPYTVRPHIGDWMLRLGTPKPLSENQESGENTVIQVFNPNRDTILVAFRLFSWEHRGNDYFLLDLQDMSETSTHLRIRNPETEEDIEITMPDGSSYTFDRLPIELPLKVGKRGEFLDTDWVEVEIFGITPDPDTELSLVYSTGGTKNSAHATWAYFDSANTPPVADFELSPQSPPEGSVVDLVDLSYDPDEPADNITNWEWKVIWNNGDEWAVSNLKKPFFIPPNEGEYSITLTVWDSYNETDSKTMVMEVVNAPPKVNALNIEVLPNTDANLIGRFIDPGWRDKHSAEFSIDDSLYDGFIQEDNLAFMDTGIVTSTIPVAETNLSGTLAVYDLDENANRLSSGSDQFIVEVVSYNSERHEGATKNDTIGTATVLESDTIYLSYLQLVDDVDVFEVVESDGGSLSAGSDILVTLKDLPADYDLLIISQQPIALEPGGWDIGGWDIGGWDIGGWDIGGWDIGGWDIGGWDIGGWDIGGWDIGGWDIGGWDIGGWDIGSFEYFPLSLMGFTGIEIADDNISVSDISLSELGLSLEELTVDVPSDQNIKVVGFSANRGTTEEAILAHTDVDSTRIFVVVVGANDTYSNAPYSLQIETSKPLDIATWIASQDIKYDPPVSSWNDVSDPTLPYEYAGEPKTLFVTQKERIIGRYDQQEDQPDWDEIWTALTNLADHPEIAGDIISVPISIYEDWDKKNEAGDTNYHSIDKTNQVTLEIRDFIRAHLSKPLNEGQESPKRGDTIQYVVIIGNDDIIPFHRVPDETSVGNERQYIMNSLLKPGGPIFYSVLGGYILTDDYYVDEKPIPWQGRSLYVPDLAISRLIEKPAEIIAAAEEFIGSEGVLNGNTALVTGYDFFNDGAQAVISALIAGGLEEEYVDSLISELWNADQLRSMFLGTGYDINNINAHYTHFSAVSAAGYDSGDFTDLLTSLEVSAEVTNLNNLTFSMGCHAGLNVPDEAALSAEDIGLDINPQLDFAQAMHLAIYLASTGFGYGDDVGIGGTEHLMGIFTEELLHNSTPDGVTVGEAVLAAKQRYLTITSPLTVYDEKSSIQFELYGLPQYTVQHFTEGSGSSVVPLLNQTVNSSNTPPNLNIQDGETSHSVSYILQKVTPDPNKAESYYTANGDAQATAFRPIQPRVVVDTLPSIDLPLETSQLYPAHGILLLDGQFIDEYDFNPVITRPTIEWELVADESQILPPIFWPSELAVIKSLETGGQLVQTLVVIPGQFRITGFENGSVIGTQRRYTNLAFELLRSPLDDWEPPIISSIDLNTDGNSTVAVTIETSDVTTGNSGIARIFVYRIGNGTVTPTSLVLSEPLPDAGEFTINVPDVGENDKLTGVVVDGAGNIASFTAKGASMFAIQFDAGVDWSYITDDPANFEATISDFESLTSPVWFIWSFGDGEFESGVLGPEDVTINDGTATFTVSHTYDENAPLELTATLRILDANGGIGADNLFLYRDPQSDVNNIDEANIIGAYVTNNATTMNICLYTVGEISDNYQYRIKLDPESGGVSHLKYSAGNWTGLSSLQVDEYGDELCFTFSLADIGVGIGESISWSAETQSGIPSVPEKGIIDEMPDSDFFGYFVF